MKEPCECERRIMSPVNLFGPETAKYHDEWIDSLKKLARKRAEAGKFPMEFIVSSPPVEPGGDQSSAGREQASGPTSQRTGAEAGGAKQLRQDEVDEKIAAAIMAKVKVLPRPVIVLIGGGGAAGKSVFAKRLREHLESPDGYRMNVQRLELDHYFYPVELIADRESDGKYDNPLNSDLLRAKKTLQILRGELQLPDGELLTVPVHDRDKHLRAEQSSRPREELRTAQIILVDGLYCLGPILCELGDIGIYIDASPRDRAKGRVWRDVNVRVGRDEEHVVGMLMGREVYHRMFVEPTQFVADYIIRRPPTGGELKVFYKDEVAECLAAACQKVGLEPERIDLLTKLFDELQKGKEAERAAQTEP